MPEPLREQSRWFGWPEDELAKAVDSVKGSAEVGGQRKLWLPVREEEQDGLGWGLGDRLINRWNDGWMKGWMDGKIEIYGYIDRYID